MSLRFRYQPVLVGHPVVSLGGLSYRPRPLIAVNLIGPTDSWTDDALLDTGADDTVFPERVAALIGLDLSGAPTGTGAGVGMQVTPLRYAQVMMRIADNQEQREWTGWIGFTPAKLRHPVLGFAGFLQFFIATFLGDREEVELAVNSLYPGS